MTISPEAENLNKRILIGGGAIGAIIGAPLLESWSNHASTVEDVVLFICGAMGGASLGIAALFLVNSKNYLFRNRQYK